MSDGDGHNKMRLVEVIAIGKYNVLIHMYM